MSMLPFDHEDRVRATMTFNRNVVVTAGAGTGKTTLLINRLLHLLMREPGALPVTALVALTFTHKSAHALLSRLREVLEKLTADETSETAEGLMDVYGLEKSIITTRAAAALQALERSEIGTIHHFATSLLRLYPMEAGVDPQFRIDAGNDLSGRLFERCWRAWLEKELAADSPRKVLWLSLLAQFSLSEMEAFAQCITSDPASFALLLERREKGLPLPISHWLKSLEKTAAALLETHPAHRKIETLCAAALTLFQRMEKQGPQREHLSEAERNTLQNGKAGKVKGWEDSEFKAAETLIKIARQFIQIDEDSVHRLCKLINPFVKLFHEKAQKEAFISFDALLIKARDLLRDHPVIREELKYRYQAVLIDEFQDTDPVQYEILLYLAEQPGLFAQNWRAVKLTPGKLFVVGDPKQSIYGFRRADIEAYHAVREMILEQDGIHCTLRANFRSHGKILDVVNGIFQRVMIPKEGIQPEYIPIHPGPSRTGTAATAATHYPFRQVSLRVLQNTGGKWNAETAREREGEAIAQWLTQEVLGKAMIHGAEGMPRTVEKGDVAILMRTLTGVHYILEPLRRAGIAYWVEGERHFYRNQVVIDAINLLRTVADPTDQIALAATLRSPIVGLNDEAIYRLQQTDHLNYGQETETLDKHLPEFYGILSRLHEISGRIPVSEAVSHIFNETPIRLIAAASTDGAQALANLEKIEQEAERLGKEGGMSFRAVAAFFERAVREDTEAPDSPLAEATVDAVKVFSIHKAKGLEFPVVVLAACQAAVRAGERDHVILRHDWSTGLSGLRIGETRDLVSVFLAEKTRLREIEEEKRLLYVAMTRAREHLMISAALNTGESTLNNGSLPGDETSTSTLNAKIQPGSLLSHLHAALGDEENALLTGGDSGTLLIGDGLISKTVFSEIQWEPAASPAEAGEAPPTDFEAAVEQWKQRFKIHESIQNTPVFISPTWLKATDETSFTTEKNAPSRPGGAISVFVGQLSHRFLETWDFSSDAKTYLDKLSFFLARADLPKNGMTQTLLFQEMEEIFGVFFSSPAYEELAQAKILGREVPFMIPWEGEVLAPRAEISSSTRARAQVMSGKIDLIYEYAGRLYIADYKTDRIKKTEIPEVARQYHHQCQIYPAAVRRALQREVAGTKLIFLRWGVAHFVESY